MEIEHSRLLKFFKETRQDKPNMAEAPEIPVIKIQKEYQNPPNVQAEVPGKHEIRDYDEKKNNSEVLGAENDKNNSSEIKITGADFTLSPIITITKNESTLTKGDMKLQKVTVSEDIAEEDLKNGGYRISREVETVTEKDKTSAVLTVERSKTRTEDIVIEKMEGEEKSQDEKKSKIPMLRLTQVVERVKKERQAQKAREQPRRSSIPKLKDAKKVIKRDTSLNFTPQVDDEFDKLYEEIVDSKQENIEEKLPSVTSIEDPEKIETKFEEIIHAYDEDEHAKQTVSRVSKIPSLRRIDDGSSRLGALIDRAKEKSTKTESKLKDGGFKVTASTIKTKRFSRGNSRDLSSEQHIEVTNTIDIKETGDNDVFVKETIIKNTASENTPERNFRNVSKRVIADNKSVEGGGIKTTVTENLDKKDGTQNKTKRFNRTVSKATRERNLNRELSKNLENVRREYNSKIEDARIGDEFHDVNNDIITTETIKKYTESTPIKTEKTIHSVSKEINDDGQNINSTETVTVEELEDGGTRTITTRTTETLVIGTPVVTEKVIRSISRNISTEGQNNTIKYEESTDSVSKNASKETHVRENKGIPVKTERFTRGISREVGNIKQSSSSSNREIVTAVENSNLDTKEHMKETKTTEEKEKEGSKGIPVYTKVTRSFSKGKIQNVEMSRSIEWKPADEVKTKNFSRSVSEKITQKELKDVGKSKYDAPTAINDVTDINDISTEENNSTDIQNKTPKDPVLESIIKDTVKNIANKITNKKVTEYKSEEQVRNVAKTTFTLTSDIDLTVEKDLTACREIGTQMSIDRKPAERNFKFVKEIGTQMVSDSPFDRDFKLAKERNLKDKSKIAYTTINGDGQTSKEFDTQKSTENTVSSSVDGNPEGAREFGTQMSVIGKIIDKDVKVTKEVGTQMSVESNKQIQENDPSKENTTGINKDSALTDESEKECSKLVTLNKDRDIPETTILKGNVSRLKDKIRKETAVVSKREPKEGLPKRTSVVSKIAIFERQELKEPIIHAPKQKIKCKYVPPDLSRMNSADRPKIVDELLKENVPSEPLGDAGKVEIDVNYEEVSYTSEPAGNREFSRTEETYRHLSEIKQVNVETMEVAHSEKETKDIKRATIRSGTTNLKAQGSQIELAKTTKEKTQLQREPSVIEMPTIIPAKINYEADIGKTKPGKINLNNWSTQVEINKSTVDKIEFLRRESRHDISQTLTGKVEFKTTESQVASETIDFKREETLAGRIDSKSNETRNGESDNVPAVTHSYRVEDVTILPAKIDFNVHEIHTDIATTVPGKAEANSNQTEFTKTLTAFGYTSVEMQPKDNSQTSQKVVTTKPTPGKINLNLWQNQVESNKTLIGKANIIKNSKQSEIAKALSGRPNFNNKPVRITDTSQQNAVLNKREYSNQAVVTTLPGTIDFSSSEEPKILTGEIEYETEFVTNESKAEISETLQDNIYFDSTDNQPETTVSQQSSVERVGKLDLKAWEHQVEVNKTLVDKLDVVKSEHLEDIVKTLPGKLDFITYQSHVGEAKAFQAPINLNTEDQAEIAEIETDENDVPKILPGAIEFNPYKQTPRFNPLPMLMRLNSQDNKVSKETDQGGNVYKDNNIYKVEIPIEPNPGETLSDPELVDEDPAVEVKLNKDTIIGSIKKKMFFISKKNSFQDSTNTPVPVATKNDNNENRADELQTKAYSVNDIGHKTYETKTVSSMASVATSNAIEITAETIEESYSCNISENNMGNSATEYELSGDTNTVQNKLTKDADDFKTSADNKQYLGHTHENEFNVNVDKVGNELTRSAYGADDFKTSKEELKRAKSLAELDLGDAVHGQVKRIVGRIKSVDFGRRESIRTEIKIKEMPKKLTVREKILLFEVSLKKDIIHFLSKLKVPHYGGIGLYPKK